MPVYEFPANYDTAPCFLVAINGALIPLVAGALREFEERRLWASDDDYERGYNAIVELEACMTALCIGKLIESQDRIYRLLESAIYGTIYTASGAGTPDDPTVINPPLPTVPPASYALPGLLRQAEISGRQLDNLTNGTIYDEAPDPRNIRQQLDDLKAALEAQENLDPEILAKLSQIAETVL